MKLSKGQLELLKGIRSKTRHGDISSIAEKTGFTKEYVSLVLNPKSERFNEDIVREAIALIAKHEQSTKNLLNKLSEVA